MEQIIANLLVADNDVIQKVSLSFCKCDFLFFHLKNYMKLFEICRFETFFLITTSHFRNHVFNDIFSIRVETAKFLRTCLFVRPSTPLCGIRNDDGERVSSSGLN